MIKGHKKIGEILIEKGLITRQQLNDALLQQQKSKEFLGIVLLKKGQVSWQDLLTALAEQFNISFTTLKSKDIDWSVADKFSASLISEHKCFPIAKDNSSVTVAITNPLDVWGLQKAEEEARGYKLKVVLISEEDMQNIMQGYKQYKMARLSNRFKQA